MVDSFTPNVDAEISPAYTPEQEAQLIADGDITKEQAAHPNSAPEADLILGKFKTQDDLVKAYESLEQKLSEPGTATGDVGGLLNEAGDYFSENGELSEAHYEQFSNNGIPRDYVDRYLNGISATADAEGSKLMGSIGGEENFTQMTGWMSESIPESEINAYNNVVEKGTNEEVSVLLQGMYARYKAATGAGATRLQGQVSPSAAGYRSRAEVMTAMSDPQYGKDPAFRAAVERKLSVTPDTVF